MADKNTHFCWYHPPQPRQSLGAASFYRNADFQAAPLMAGSMLDEEMVTGSPHKVRYLELQWLAIIFPLKIAIWWVYPISVTAQIISSWLVIYTVYIYISHRDIPIKSIPIMVAHPMKNPHFVKPPLPGPWPAAPSSANFGPGSASAASGERAVGTPGGYEALLGWRYRCNYSICWY